MVTMGLDIGGAETHIVELCRALSSMGHDIYVASNGGAYESVLLDAGVKHISLPLNTKRPDAIFKSYFGLYNLIKKEKFDIVHAHARIPAFICGLIRKRLDFRFTTTAHLDFKVNPLLKLMSNWGEKSLAVSADIKTYLINNYGISPDNISLTINGINGDTFSSEICGDDIIREFGLNEKSTKIVYISRIDDDRSLVAFQLVSIAPDLLKSFPDIEIVIVGSGNDFDKLKEKADSANNLIGHKAVFLAGARTDINKFVAVSDIFVAVSRSALEAMSAAKPVIVAGNQGYMGIFDESLLKVGIETNFCCRGCGDSTEEKLKADLLCLLNADKEHLLSLGEYNRRIVRENYSVERMTDDYLKLFDSLPPYTDFRYPDIVVSGYYGFNNMGDDALLETLTGKIRDKSPNVKISVLANKPKELSEKAHITTVNRLNIFSVRHQMRHAKILISGGGTLLQDSTSVKSLFYYTYIMKLANKCGTKLFVYANGIGPLYKDISKKRAKSALLLADYISVREPDSKDILLSLGIPEDRIVVSADPVFMIDSPLNDKSVFEELGGNANESYFVVSVRECVGKINKEYSSSSFEDTIIDACRKISQKYNLVPVLLPMQEKHDAKISKKILSAVGKGFIADNFDSKNACSLISGSSFVIGMRLHTLIFSSCVSVPMIAISYDPKINGMMKYLDQPAPLDIKSMKAEDIVECADKLIENQNVRSQLSEKISVMRNLAGRDIEEVIKNL